MVSSALYRYFPSRDDLLTALIIDAYDAVGAEAEAAAAKGGTPRERWRALCGAIRAWARRNPHEYALVYGSPVPGYEAPQTTIGPASRVPIALIGVVRDAVPHLRVQAGGPLPAQLADQAERVVREVGGGLPIPVMARVLVVWTQLYGMLSFELFGHLVGSADPADAFFGYAVEQMADLIGLPDGATTAR